MINDAAMQALGSYEGGRMLFLGLGTGLGSALVADGVLAPLELAHLPYRRNKTYEQYSGRAGSSAWARRSGRRTFRRVVAMLKDGLQVEYVVLGGGQTKKLKGIPKDVAIGQNHNAIIGGLRLWSEPEHSHLRRTPFMAHSRRSKRRV